MSSWAKQQKIPPATPLTTDYENLDIAKPIYNLA